MLSFSIFSRVLQDFGPVLFLKQLKKCSRACITADSSLRHHLRLRAMFYSSGTATRISDQASAIVLLHMHRSNEVETKAGNTSWTSGTARQREHVSLKTILEYTLFPPRRDTEDSIYHHIYKKFKSRKWPGIWAGTFFASKSTRFLLNKIFLFSTCTAQFTQKQRSQMRNHDTVWWGTYFCGIRFLLSRLLTSTLTWSLGMRV